MYVAQGLIPSKGIKPACNPAFERQRHQAFRVILGYTVSPKSATWDLLQKKRGKKGGGDEITGQSPENSSEYGKEVESMRITNISLKWGWGAQPFPLGLPQNWRATPRI